jgi:RNA polymerase sigma-70 factor (ECF subfamily)
MLASFARRWDRVPFRFVLAVTTTKPEDAAPDPERSTDEELMLRWVDSRSRGRGDLRAFEALYRRYRGKVRGRIAATLGSGHRSRIDDVFQDVWLEVARAVAFKPTSFAAWILVVARNKALGTIEANPPERSVSPGTRTRDADADDASAADPFERLLGPAGSTPESVASARSVQAEIVRALEVAPEAQRTAWQLHYVDGLTLDAVADRMGSPRPTARTRLRLANERIATHFAGRGLDVEKMLEDA